MPEIPSGWGWLDRADAATPSATAQETGEIARAFTRCFRGRDGARVLAHLRAITIERRLGPDVGEPLLRYLEGQRGLVAYIDALVERGHDPA